MKGDDIKKATMCCSKCIKYQEGLPFGNMQCPFIRYIPEVSGYRIVFPYINWDKDIDFCSKFLKM